VKLRRAALGAAIIISVGAAGAAGTVIAHSAPGAAKVTCLPSGSSYTHLRMPTPLATAGSLPSGASVPFFAQALNGAQCVPGATIWLAELSNVSSDTLSIPASQCGGQSELGTSPVACTTDSTGKVAMTYTVPTTVPPSGTFELAAVNSITHPTIDAIEWYLYELIYQFSTSPIAPNASLTGGQTVPETLTVSGVGGTPEKGFLVDLSLTSTASLPGTVMVGTTQLTSTPQGFLTDSNGNIQMTYLSPPTLPTTGIDTIHATSDTTSNPAVTMTASYDFAASDPVISVGDQAQVEGDAQPHIFANFDVTLSAPQSVPVSVQYITVCGIGDKTCMEDYLQTLKPHTLTIPAGATSAEISVKIYSYPADEPYNEGYFVQLLKPSTGVLGRSLGQGTILADDETTLNPILYIGDTGVVCGVAGNQTAYFTITLSSPETAPVTFNYASQDGSAIGGTDYDPVSGVATIPTGSTSVVIPVTILPNPVPGSGPKTYMLNITNPSAGTTIERPTGVGTILNWDGM
jgi:hypothetical protein